MAGLQPLAVAALHMMDPYRAGQGQGRQVQLRRSSPTAPTSSRATWNKDKGGTFVRNTEYDPKTDDKKIRKANPDKIVFQVGRPTEIDLRPADRRRGRRQVRRHDRSVAAGVLHARSQGAVADRSVNVESPFVDYLLPNFHQHEEPEGPRGAQGCRPTPTAWITAGGGEKAYAPAESIVNPAVVGYKDNPAFSGPQSGDPAAAKKLLEEAGVEAAVPDHVHLPDGSDDR